MGEQVGVGQRLVRHVEVDGGTHLRLAERPGHGPVAQARQELLPQPDRLVGQRTGALRRPVEIADGIGTLGHGRSLRRSVAPMVVLPDPPPTLPPAPRAFYDALRRLVAEVAPAEVDPTRMEVDFGDSGVAVTFPHASEPDWVLAAQVSRRAAVVFAGPLTEHFRDAPDAPAGDTAWTAPAVELVGRVLCGELAVPVALRGDTLVRVGPDRVWSPGALAVWKPLRTELVRLDFGGRRAGS